MIFLGEAKAYFSCPDKTIKRKCNGKIKFAMQSYRVARGRGYFVVATNKFCKCNRCGRTFEFKEITDAEPDVDRHFRPISKKKRRMMKKIRPRRAE
jgi:hypothetical protein